jgi:hypothetical protein
MGQTLIEASGPVTLKWVKGKSKISPNGCVLRHHAKYAAVSADSNVPHSRQFGEKAGRSTRAGRAEELENR